MVCKEENKWSRCLGKVFHSMFPHRNKDVNYLFKSAENVLLRANVTLAPMPSVNQELKKKEPMKTWAKFIW